MGGQFSALGDTMICAAFAFGGAEISGFYRTAAEKRHRWVVVVDFVPQAAGAP
jgi:hypothetical protein